MNTKVNVQKEDTIERYFVRQILSYGGTTYKFVSPGRRGVADQVATLPGCGTFFVELKRPRGGVTAFHQTKFRDDINISGGRAYQARNETEVDAIIQLELSNAGHPANRKHS